MSSLLLGVLLAAPALAVPAPGDLTAAALGGARPVECRSDSRELGDFWRRARSPELDKFCRLLARGYARLGSDPRAAIDAAAAAELVRPGTAATSQLLGRAKLRLVDAEGAWREFERAEARRPGSIIDATALHELAIAALQTGHGDRARAAFRKLLPRASLLPSAAERQRVELEAAMAAMAEGRAGLDEAIGIITRARRGPGTPGFSALFTAALALAFDRQGQAERARTLTAELEGPRAVERWAAGPGPRIVLPPGEWPALVAIVAGRTDPERALEQWRAYLAAVVNGPWVGHARAKVSVLAAKSGARR